MKKFKYEFEVDDDFKMGDCDNCPLEDSAWGDGCSVGDCNGKCPLIEVKQEEIC